VKATRIVTFLFATSLIGTTPVIALQHDSPPQAAPALVATKPITALAWLVGGVWTADASKLGPGLQRIETRYSWSDNGSYIRFTTRFVSDKSTLKNYDGNFFWDPTRHTLAMWYMDASNNITQGPTTFTGDHWQMAFRGDDFAGKPSDLQVDVLRRSNDLYHWSLSEKDDDSWKTLLELDYARKQ
jgi:hypothetical protein